MAALITLAALLLLEAAAAQVPVTGQTRVGQLPNDAMAYFAGWLNPCVQQTATDGKICTRLSKGGPNNATYMSGFTYVLHGHQISVETNLQQTSSNDLIVTVDGKPLTHDPLLNDQNYTFQGTPNIVLKWSLSSANQLPAVTITSGKLEHQVFMTAATPDRPAQLGRKDNQPTAYGRLEPSATQDPVAVGFGGRQFDIQGLDSGAYYCLLTSSTQQLAAKVLKAGPADNQTLYIVGLGFMYKDHNASVEISDDGLSLNVTVDGKLISMDPDVHEVSNTYNSSDGGQMTVLWQQYRPLLGDTTELSTDMLQVTTWLAQLSTEGAAQNIPAFISVEAILLQKAQPAAFQGMLGETYDRLLAGDAIMDPTNPLHLPDDGKWHGIGNESHYKMDSYFDTNHTFNLFGGSGFSQEAIQLRRSKHLPIPAGLAYAASRQDEDLAGGSSSSAGGNAGGVGGTGGTSARAAWTAGGTIGGTGGGSAAGAQAAADAQAAASALAGGQRGDPVAAAALAAPVTNSAGSSRPGSWTPDTRFIATTAGLLAAVVLCSCMCFAVGRRTGGAKSGAADPAGRSHAPSAVFPFSLQRYQKHKDDRP